MNDANAQMATEGLLCVFEELQSSIRLGTLDPCLKKIHAFQMKDASIFTSQSVGWFEAGVDKLSTEETKYDIYAKRKHPIFDSRDKGGSSCLSFALASCY